MVGHWLTKGKNLKIRHPEGFALCRWQGILLGGQQIFSRSLLLADEIFMKALDAYLNSDLGTYSAPQIDM